MDGEVATSDAAGAPEPPSITQDTPKSSSGAMNDETPGPSGTTSGDAPGPSSGDAPGPSSGDAPGPSESKQAEEEEESDLKLAWELLELARVICQR